MARKDPEAIRITSVTQSHSADISARQRRYIISMGVRTVCFLLAVVFAGTFLMWVFILASFLLPSIAVVMANAQARTDPDPRPDTAFDPMRPELEPPPPQ
jgi:Mn2+/Fe2+ NRAMP family transporter